MKPVRLFVALLALTVFVTAFAFSLPVSSNVMALPAQRSNNLALDLPLDTPLTFMAGAPAVTLALEALPSASNYSCSLVSQTPANWTHMKGRQYFDAKWTLKNIGARNWGVHGIDVKFISFSGGTKMHTSGTLFDLPKETAPGKKITLVVDMNAPKAKGYYSEQWGLFTGNVAFCRFSITINVTH
jgi:hypothetical protein